MAAKFFLIVLLGISQLAFAEDIYRSQSKSGSISFSNKNKGDSAKISLPQIIKQKDFGAGKNQLSSCSNHGGFDCSKGPDSDGSVVCYDGFKDSMQRYVLSCGKAKLRVIEQSLKHPSQESTSFIVRNLSTVKAENIQLKSSYCMAITGDKEIAAHDSAEFICNGKMKNLSSLEILCSNC